MRIADLSESQFQAVKATLGKLKPAANLDVLVKKATADESSVPDLRGIIQAVLNLSIGRTKTRMPLSEFVSGISTSVTPPREKIGIFEQRVKELVEVEAIALSARAYDIQHEFEKVLTQVRIITDIRPVFDSPGAEIVGAMVVHNLSVGYFEDGDYKETVFAMDDGDLSLLKGIIERAEQKGAALIKMINKSGVNYLDSRSE